MNENKKPQRYETPELEPIPQLEDAARGASEPVPPGWGGIFKIFD